MVKAMGERLLREGAVHVSRCTSYEIPIEISCCAMELPIIFAAVTSLIVIASSHPKNSDVIPKEYYKRQILQPIPGYIPVYIKADGEPLVRRESKKPVVNVHPQKTAEPKEKNLSEHAAKKTSLEKDEKAAARTDTDEISKGKDVSGEPQKKIKLAEKQNQNEKESPVGMVAHRKQTVL